MAMSSQKNLKKQKLSKKKSSRNHRALNNSMSITLARDPWKIHPVKENLRVDMSMLICNTPMSIRESMNDTTILSSIQKTPTSMSVRKVVDRFKKSTFRTVPKKDKIVKK